MKSARLNIPEKWQYESESILGSLKQNIIKAGYDEINLTVSEEYKGAAITIDTLEHLTDEEIQILAKAIFELNMFSNEVDRYIENCSGNNKEVSEHTASIRLPISKTTSLTS